MRGHPSLLLVYMGLATCLDTLPHGEQNQGECLWEEPCRGSISVFLYPGYFLASQAPTLLPQIQEFRPQPLPSDPQVQVSTFLAQK